MWSGAGVKSNHCVLENHSDKRREDYFSKWVQSAKDKAKSFHPPEEMHIAKNDKAMVSLFCTKFPSCLVTPHFFSSKLTSIPQIQIKMIA
jgi:hypothetical protein